MKATGIVRRIDDIGRIVIPKEIRRSMHVREGDALEIYTGEGGVIFKKYSSIGKIPEFAQQCAEAAHASAHAPVIVCDCYEVIAVAGALKKGYMGRTVSPYMREKIKTPYVLSLGNDPVYPFEKMQSAAQVVYPIISEKKVIGYVVILTSRPSVSASDGAVVAAQMTANLIEKQMEW